MTSSSSEIRKFVSFDEAKKFAQSLAAEAIRHKVARDKNFWVVEFEPSTAKDRATPYADACQHCQSLSRELARAKSEHQSISRQLRDLSFTYKNLKQRYQSGADEEISTRIEDGVREYKRHYEKLSEELGVEKQNLAAMRLQQSEAKNALDLERTKFTLLCDEFEKTVGPFKFETKKLADGKRICHRCGGDGGINQGCPSCNGSGMVENFRFIQQIVMNPRR